MLCQGRKEYVYLNCYENQKAQEGASYDNRRGDHHSNNKEEGWKMTRKNITRMNQKDALIVYKIKICWSIEGSSPNEIESSLFLSLHGALVLTKQSYPTIGTIPSSNIISLWKRRSHRHSNKLFNIHIPVVFSICIMKSKLTLMRDYNNNTHLLQIQIICMHGQLKRNSPKINKLVACTKSSYVTKFSHFHLEVV